MLFVPFEGTSETDMWAGLGVILMTIVLVIAFWTGIDREVKAKEYYKDDQ
jgi:hypothetical protein